MHLAADGGSMAQRKMKALIQAFSFACIIRVLSQYAIGILWVRMTGLYPLLSAAEDV
jgi:hypothetical protein